MIIKKERFLRIIRVLFLIGIGTSTLSIIQCRQGTVVIIKSEEKTPLLESASTFSYTKREFVIDQDDRSGVKEIIPESRLETNGKDITYEIIKVAGGTFKPSITLNPTTGIIRVAPSVIGTGVYTVCAKAEGYKTQTTKLVVTVQGVPGEPLALGFVPSQDFVSIRWSAPQQVGSYGAPSLEYHIYYVKDEGQELTVEELVEDAKTHSQVKKIVTQTNFLLQGLDPSTHYFIVIKTYNVETARETPSSKLVVHEFQTEGSSFMGAMGALGALGYLGLGWGHG